MATLAELNLDRNLRKALQDGTTLDAAIQSTSEVVPDGSVASGNTATDVNQGTVIIRADHIDAQSINLAQGFTNTQLTSVTAPANGLRIDYNGIYGYKGGVVQFSIDTSGNALFSGTVQTATSGQRIDINSGANNALRFFDSVGQVIGIGTDAGDAIRITGTAGTNFGVNMTSSISGVGFRYENSADVTAYGVDIYLTGASNTGADIRFRNDGTTGAFGLLGTFTNGAVPIYLDKSGSGQSIEIFHGASGDALDITKTGNYNTPAVSITSTTTSANPVGIAMNLSSGGSSCFAFDFEGSEQATAASIIGVVNKKIKVKFPSGVTGFLYAYDG